MSIDYILSKHHGAPVPDKVLPMGDADSVRRALSQAYPSLDWQDNSCAPSVGVVDSDNNHIEFRLIYQHTSIDLQRIYTDEHREPTYDEIIQAYHGTGQIMSVAVCYSSGNTFIGVMRELCRTHDWTLWDLQCGQAVKFH